MTSHDQHVVRWTDETLELGEGARWVDDRLVLVDILNGSLYSTAGDRPNSLQPLARLEGHPLGAVAPLRSGPGWIAAAGQGIGLLAGSGHLTWVAELEPITCRMNDGGCDPVGRFWAGSMAYDGTPDAGSLYRVDPDLSVHKMIDGLSIVNGPAFSTDGSILFLSDSGHGRILKFPVDPETGIPGAPQTFAELPNGSPDGLTVDAEDHLWVAIWGAGEVRRYRPDGTLDVVLTLPVPQPTSVCLGGPNLDRLFITTASYGLEPAPPGSGAVWAIDLPTPGLPTNQFNLHDPAREHTTT
ncbi:MAG: SMP-30/gluconolactonase/LRE family protein [Streptosporangiales bacterium]|nr:SMP-30/gluconolactonase/LRE family protein [Streptosporangiales bacterium]